MRNRDRLKGKAKMRADLEAKSKKSLPHQEAPNIGKYKKAATKLSSKTYKGLTAKQKSGADDVKPGWKVNKGPGGGLRPSKRKSKRKPV